MAVIPRGNAGHVDQAVEGAQIDWGRVDISIRADLLEGALGELQAGLEERARLYVRENGKPISDARAELANLRNRLIPVITAARNLQTETAANDQTIVQLVPYGVVAVIVPWNTPVILAFLQIIPALVAGNAVIEKPPETCPATLMQTLKLFASSLPRGIVNIVTGLQNEVSDAVINHAGVEKIAFTGRISTARHIMAVASKSLKTSVMKRGGNDPAIFLEVADLSDETMAKVVNSVFRISGQVCMAIKRIYVHEALYEQLVTSLVRHAENIIVGDGMQAGVMIGPLHRAEALQNTKTFVEDALERDAMVRVLGRFQEPDSSTHGHFMRPHVITDIPDDARIVVEEQFCPVIPILSYRNEDDVVRRSNDTHYGLSTSIWSDDAEKAKALADRLEAGMVLINTHGTASVDVAVASGGLKQSGNGVQNGVAGIREYLQQKTITVARPSEERR